MCASLHNKLPVKVSVFFHDEITTRPHLSGNAKKKFLSRVEKELSFEVPLKF